MNALKSCIILLLVISPALGQANDCEKLAKDYRAKYGGDLILIQPLTSSGSYDLGEYNGHWLNKAWNKQQGIYYYDSQSNEYFNLSSEVLEWYEWTKNKEAVFFNYNKGEVPFGIIWHY